MNRLPDRPAKNRSASRKPGSAKLLALSLGISAAVLSPSARAVDYYWDINGTADSANGTTATAAGNWNGTTANFNTDSTGGAGGTLIAAPTNADLVHFSAGMNATGAFNVTVAGAQTALGLLFEEGSVTITGGTSLTLGDTAGTVGSATVDAASGRTGVINTVLTGTSGLTKTGAGTLNLGTNNTTVNTFTGGIFINEGTVVSGQMAGGTGAGIAGTGGLGANNVTLGTVGGALNAALQVNRNQNFLSSAQTITVNAGTGTLRIAGGPGLSLNQQPTILAPITMNGPLTIGNGAGGSIGGVALGGVITGSSTITIDGANAGTTTSGTASVSEGAGTIAVLNANNSTALTSAINVVRGSLRLSAIGAGGTGNLNVMGAGGIASLSGVGSALGNVNVTNNNVIAPGLNTIAGATGNTNGGNLHIGTAGGTLGLATGAGKVLTLSAASLFYDLSTNAIAATGNDLVNTDTLTLGGPIVININGLTSGSLDTTNAYTLINAATAVNGFNAANITTNFLGTLAGQYQAAYSINGTNDLIVSFTPVPEPGAWAMMLAGGLGLFAGQRRLRRRAA